MIEIAGSHVLSRLIVTLIYVQPLRRWIEETGFVTANVTVFLFFLMNSYYVYAYKKLGCRPVMNITIH